MGLTGSGRLFARLEELTRLGIFQCCLITLLVTFPSYPPAFHPLLLMSDRHLKGESRQEHSLHLLSGRQGEGGRWK